MKLVKVMLLLGMMNGMVGACSKNEDTSNVSDANELHTPLKKAEALKAKFESDFGLVIETGNFDKDDYKAFNNLFGEVYERLKGQRFESIGITFNNSGNTMQFVPTSESRRGLTGYSSVSWDRDRETELPRLRSGSRVELSLNGFRNHPITSAQIVIALQNARILLARQQKMEALLKSKLKYAYIDDRETYDQTSASCSLHIKSQADLEKRYTETDNPFDSAMANVNGVLTDGQLVTAINSSKDFRNVAFYAGAHDETDELVAIDGFNDLVIKVDAPNSLAAIKGLLSKLVNK